MLTKYLYPPEHPTDVSQLAETRLSGILGLWEAAMKEHVQSCTASRVNMRDEGVVWLANWRTERINMHSMLSMCGEEDAVYDIFGRWCIDINEDITDDPFNAYMSMVEEGIKWVESYRAGYASRTVPLQITPSHTKYH